MKACSRCKEPKALTEFHLNDGTKDGRHPWCKSCQVARAREIRQAKASERTRMIGA